ncbi:MAG TPA: hypothetical protein VJM31_19795 [Vicinamibacterales bacterium]|nr:hypothetical protein [Vicinamibacterales bacterium]
MSLKKDVAYAVWPRAATVVSSVRARRQSHRLVKEWGLFELNRRLFAEFGDKVVAGPFKGLILNDASRSEHIGPYLLGTYEMELHDTWARILRQTFNQVIDVDASFGYYAVGLASRFPNTPTVVFDTDWWARRAARDMARTNCLTNVTVKSVCSPAWLARNLRPRALIVSDCEGHEGQLFHGEIPNLDKATLVVEVHEQFVPGVTDRLRARFHGTHMLEVIDSRSRSPHPPRAKTLTPDEMKRALQEVRGQQQWFVLRPLVVTGT